VLTSVKHELLFKLLEMIYSLLRKPGVYFYVAQHFKISYTESRATFYKSLNALLYKSKHIKDELVLFELISCLYNRMCCTHLKVLCCQLSKQIAKILEWSILENILY